MGNLSLESTGGTLAGFDSAASFGNDPAIALVDYVTSGIRFSVLLGANESRFSYSDAT